MAGFRERIGTQAPNTVLQLRDMDDELRTEIYNAWYLVVTSRFGNKVSYVTGQTLYQELDEFGRRYWSWYLKKPADEAPTGGAVLPMVKKDFFTFEWDQVYEFIEELPAWLHGLRTLVPSQVFSGYHEVMNGALDRGRSGYRFAGTWLVPITDDLELVEVADALANASSPAKVHLTTAAELLGKRPEPDKRNSIKESISAVEATVRRVLGNDSATLGDALGILRRKHGLHAALSNGFEKIYGWTSDEGGIRHSLTETNREPSLAEARFMLVACSAFINFLTMEFET